MDYPNLVEIMIADGGSEDRTREIIAKLAQKDPRIKLIDNPEKYQSFALNRMIAAAKGDIFLRADAHCYYQDNYIQQCVTALMQTKAKNVGGAQRYKAKNLVQSGIALAVKSFLGNGGAKYMDVEYNGYGDTVFLGCFWTKDLREVGGFSTVNITNQDSELNLRLIKLFGDNSIYISSKIKSWYYPRKTLFALFKQYFRYGRGRFITKMFHTKQTPIRGILPFLFILFLLLFLLFDAATATNLHSLKLVWLLVVMVILESTRISFKNDGVFKDIIWDSDASKPNIFSRILTMSVCLIIMQIAHFSGFLYQMFRRVFLAKKGW